MKLNEIVRKTILNPFVTRMDLFSPLVGAKALAGQFVILRADVDGERIPLTVADYDRDNGIVSIIFQIVGGTTAKLNALDVGDVIPDFVGPLGRASELDGLSRVAVVGGGVGCAIAYPVAKALHEKGCCVDSIAGFRSADLVILADEFKAVSDNYILVSDDGSAGEKGLVTDALKKQIEAGVKYDKVITIGPLIMMKFVAKLTREYGIPTVCSMNPVMIDGTGMCGGCRLSVGGKTVFACVDGPDFDAHLVDFDTAMERGRMYAEFENNAREKGCNLINA